MDNFFLKVKLISLTPVKLLHIWSERLRRSQLGEFLFATTGVVTSFALVIYALFPFDSKWKFIIAFIGIIFIFSFEIMLLISLWKKLQIFLYNASMDGNIRYNKCRDILRRKCSNYSMGVDEKAVVTIDYFIKKNKKEKRFVYIHK